MIWKVRAPRWASPASALRCQAWPVSSSSVTLPTLGRRLMPLSSTSVPAVSTSHKLAAMPGKYAVSIWLKRSPAERASCWYRMKICSALTSTAMTALHSSEASASRTLSLRPPGAGAGLAVILIEQFLHRAVGDGQAQAALDLGGQRRVRFIHKKIQRLRIVQRDAVGRAQPQFRMGGDLLPDLDDGTRKILDVAGGQHLEQAVVGGAGEDGQVVGAQHLGVRPVVALAGAQRRQTGRRGDGREQGAVLGADQQQTPADQAAVDGYAYRQERRLALARRDGPQQVYPLAACQQAQGAALLHLRRAGGQPIGIADLAQAQFQQGDRIRRALVAQRFRTRIDDHRLRRRHAKHARS